MLAVSKTEKFFPPGSCKENLINSIQMSEVYARKDDI